MVRLTSLELKNFQVHKDTKIEFSEGITTIKGTTDSGKSAIVRALNWICLNNIAGEEFIQEGQKRTTATLEVSVPGQYTHQLVRTRGKGGAPNTYELEGKEFKAFGSSVPADIATLLNLNEVNFQNQHDAPFWFADTAGEVSRKLNAVVDLSLIDTALANVRRFVNTAKERETFCSEQLTEAQSKLDDLIPQEERVEQFKKLKDKHETFETLEKAECNLESVLSQVDSNQADQFLHRWVDLEGVFNLGRSSRIKARKESDLSDILIQIDDAEKNSSPPPNFQPVISAFEELQELKQDEEDLEDLCSRIEKGWLARADALTSVETNEKRFHEKIKGQRCPLCQNVIQ